MMAFLKKQTWKFLKETFTNLILNYVKSYILKNHESFYIIMKAVTIAQESNCNKFNTR